MIDLDRFSETNFTTDFTNGNKLPVYSKETKKGIRYYYFSRPRMIQISKNRIICK